MLDDIKKYFKIFFTYIRGDEIYVFVGLLLAIISELSTLAPPLLTKFLIDDIITKKNYALFQLFFIASLIIVVILLSTSLVANYLLVKSFKKAGAKLRLELFKKLQHAPLFFYNDATSGEVAYRIFQDTNVIESSWASVIRVLPLQLMMLAGGVLMILWYWQLSLFVFLILICQSLIVIKFHKPLLEYSERTKKIEQELNGFIVEHFRRIQLVHAMMTEKFEQISLFRRLHNLVKISLRTYLIGQYSGILVIVVSNFWMFGILWYGGMTVIKGQITLGTLMAFLFFANVLYRPVSSLTQLFLSFQQIRASQRRYLEYYNIKPSVVDHPRPIIFKPVKSTILVENVTFGYNGRPVLQNINLKVPEKKILALVGPSGSGKSTLCRLLVRFYDPQKGTIYFDGTDIKTISLADLRKKILYLPQGNCVFNGTILENITYGVNNVSRKSLDEALEKAVVDFLGDLPDGLNTRIGEGGINISGGEAQRIALARAFLINPDVIILDEATSYIDNKAEETIKYSLQSIKDNCTVIIVAHRNSTLTIADSVVEIHQGQVLQNNFDSLC